MALKKATGNMYSWVDYMHTHLGGECPHKCSYCYVGCSRWGRPDRYKGKIRLITKELSVNYKTDNTIFIEHMNDMFAEGVKDEWIKDIFAHCNKYKNTYVFQTKNPNRAYKFIDYFPKRFLIGTTIETNRNVQISKAPRPVDRYLGIMKFKNKAKIFITIEPIMDFDVTTLIDWLYKIQPYFINIGADSKNNALIEPSSKKIIKFIAGVQKKKISIRKKNNLQRLAKII